MVVKAFKCEVSESESVNTAVADVTKAFGRQIDIGISNAGIAVWKNAEEMSDGEWSCAGRAR